VRYRFGEFELDTERYAVVRAGKKLAVRPKVFDILRYLLERPERLVTKQELLDALWAGQHVSEASVPWTIGHARRLIGQRSSDKSPIETVHGRGYRWRAPVEVDAGKPFEAGAPAAVAPFVGREALMAALQGRASGEPGTTPSSRPT
jgi:DNA-binding winged helix-turn-helix (wHTH) protein